MKKRQQSTSTLPAVRLADEAALIAALRSGHIRHAGLDVFHNEPLPPDHALAKRENVTLSAHAAFRTPEAS
jgi:D-3-phosphoglycerate dehydrogenase